MSLHKSKPLFLYALFEELLNYKPNEKNGYFIV